MTFETGFADSNTTGKKINFDDEADFFDAKNSAERRKLKKKQESKTVKLHKKGKMVRGKYYFGDKDGAVNV
eukprot:UN04011